MEQTNVAASRRFEVRAVLVSLAVLVLLLSLGLTGHALRHRIFYAVAQRCEERGNYERAARLYTMLADYADSEQRAQNAMLSLGKLLLDQGDYEKAADTAARVDSEEGREFYRQCRYQWGVAALKAEDTETALAAFTDAGDYADAQRQIQACRSLEGQNLYREGRYSDALWAFTAAGDYGDSPERVRDCYYRMGLAYYEEGDYAAALSALAAAEDYADSGAYVDAISQELFGEASDPDRALGMLELTQAREKLPRRCLAVGFYHTVALTDSGHVLAAGDNSRGQCEVSGWENVVAVDAGAYFTAGLTADGRVLLAGDLSYGLEAAAQWTDIQLICAGDHDLIGLTRDGKVLACGWHDYSCAVQWQGVTDLSAGSYQLVGLNSRGQAFGSHASSVTREYWDLYRVAVGSSYTLGVRRDGTLVTGAPMDLSGWQNVLDVAAGSNGFLALLLDGTVRGYYFTAQAAVDLSDWTDVVAIAAGGTHYAAILADGRVVAKGMDQYGQCRTESWDLKNS